MAQRPIPPPHPMRRLPVETALGFSEQPTVPPAHELTGLDCAWCQHALTEHTINAKGLVLSCAVISPRQGGEFVRQDVCHCGPYLLDTHRLRQRVTS